ncbi:TRAP dicarboxylate transporter, DctP subunit [uncultured delta proteobacterium]|uniref:TRAP dicarboxylate transporter, DctP subunit n=1 Tax=uncultured delta proteobacterium TaxID=34034 RepID=A0A212JJB1_9DELT|nr:TRAP dicarboxylate transporter, DctP subunit [uncultured delta proteobacterium]
MRSTFSFKVLAAALLAGSFCLFASASQAAMEFKLSNQFPPNHHVSAGMRIFAEKVEEYSKGAMTAKIYDSGSLYRDAEIVKAIRGGSVEVGLVPVNKWSGMIPAVDIFDVPFAFPTLESLEKFLQKSGPIFDEAFSKYNAKVLFWVDYGYVQFFNSKRPLKMPEDFKGLTMRAYSAGDAETLKALGAAPTIISSSEMYLALQRGTIDGADTGMPAAVSRKVIEVQKYMTLANYAAAEFLVQANLKWWQGLKKEEQEIIAKASADAEKYIRDKVAEAEAQAQETVVKAGVEVHVPNAAELAAFVKATAPIRDSYLKQGGDLAAKLLPIADAAAK